MLIKLIPKPGAKSLGCLKDNRSGRIRGRRALITSVIHPTQKFYREEYFFGNTHLTQSKPVPLALVHVTFGGSGFVVSDRTHNLVSCMCISSLPIMADIFYVDICGDLYRITVTYYIDDFVFTCTKLSIE